jgi:hypothetical protein
MSTFIEAKSVVSKTYCHFSSKKREEPRFSLQWRSKLVNFDAFLVHAAETDLV